MIFGIRKLLSITLLCFNLMFFLLVLFYVSGAGAFDTVSENVTIFIYHRFGDSRYPTTNVGVDRFREQMAYLKDHDYQVIPISLVVKALKNGRSIPAKAAVITIDDGYLSVYNDAWPILKSFGYPFTIFLNVKAINRKYKDFVTWDQVREMAAAGVDIQDHTYSHHRLADRPEGMDDAAYRAWIADDLAKGSEILLKKLGYRSRYLALPYGEYNNIVMEEAGALGYEAVFTQDPGSVSKQTDLFMIPREPILGNDWASMSHFKSVLERVDLPITDMTPDLDPFTEAAPARFCARLVHPERYRTGSLGIYVSELGWNKGILEKDVVCINNSSVLKRRSNRVAVSAKEKNTGRTAIRFWLLVKP
ncbi:MAG: polysaccharide deacetylase family protein [Thermodesulfobacteriota bacterium]|nr:polysaccharide deacetylase family protein [Thermodesulfobacteriota bacterium]